MPLLTVALVIIVVGILLWAANQFVPMDAKIKQLLNVVVIIVLVLWLLQAFGIIGAVGSVRLK